MIEIIRAEFFAGEVKTFLIQGEYVEILECTYPIDVAMMDRSGAQLSTMRNAEASYFSRPGKYEVIQVTSSAAQTVRLFVGSGDAGTRRTSGQVQVVGTVNVNGDVSVIDGGKNRTLEGKAFLAIAYCPALASNYSYSQLFNPIASGKNLIIENILYGSSVAGSLSIRRNIGALTTVGTTPLSKFSGGVASVAQSRTQNFDGVIGASFYSVFCAANISYEKRFLAPIVIMPGEGLLIKGSAFAQDMSASFEYFEQPV